MIHLMQIRELNKKVALFITEKVGTMTCAYLFALIALISLPEALLSEDPLEIVSWIAETFLQLVLLSIIIVGQNIQSEIAELTLKREAFIQKKKKEMNANETDDLGTAINNSILNKAIGLGFDKPE